MKLYYFDIYGRAEPIRMLLNHAKVNFEDVRFQFPEFQKLKQEQPHLFEFGQVPVFEMKGQVFSQSTSILRMLGKMYGYYPEDPIEAWKVDSTLQANADLNEKYWDLQLAKDGEDQEKKKDEYISKTLPNYFDVMQRRLLRNSSQRYFVGNKMTIADFDNAYVAYAYFKNKSNKFYEPQNNILQNYKDLDKYYDGLKEEMADHFKNRPTDKPF